MSARIEYAPGEAWCIAAGRVVLVCERTLPAVRARALHDAAAVVDSLEGLRTVLELESAALLGVVDLEDGRVLLRRHGVPATADDAPITDRYGPEWELDEAPATATIAAGALHVLTDDVLPLDSGVVRVAAVRVAPRTADAATAPPEGVPAAADAEPQLRTGAFGETLAPPAARAAAEPVQVQPVQAEPVQVEPVQADTVQAEPVQAEPVQADTVQADPVQTDLEQTTSKPAAPEPAAPEQPAAEWAAAVPTAPAPVETAPPSAEPVTPVTFDAAPEPRHRPTANPAANPAGNPIGGLIDSVPGFIRPAVDLRAAEPPVDLRAVDTGTSAPPIATGDVGDHDGMTITAEQARRLQEERARADAQGVAAHPQEASAPATGPLVLSTLCPDGHVNAPGTRECAQCGQPVDDGSAAQRRRPEVAVAVLPSGERIPLGRGVVLGRRPRSRRAEDGRVPRLVTVESPGEDISRSHLELRVEDWNLVGIDLSSTNGTLLLRDGAAPQRLRPEASTILQLGDRLDMGDGVVVAIEPATGEP